MAGFEYIDTTPKKPYRGRLGGIGYGVFLGIIEGRVPAVLPR